MLRMVPLPVPGRNLARESSMRGPLSIRGIGGKVGGQSALPAVAILEQLGLVVDQLLAGLGREIHVRPLDDRIDRAGLLTEAAIDALGHVDVVAGGAAAAVLA